MQKMVQLTQSVINDSIMNFLPNFALDAVSVRPPLLMHISGLSVYHGTLNFLPKKSKIYLQNFIKVSSLSYFSITNKLCYYTTIFIFRVHIQHDQYMYKPLAKRRRAILERLLQTEVECQTTVKIPCALYYVLCSLQQYLQKAFLPTKIKRT